MKKIIFEFLNRRFVLGNINRNDRRGASHRAWGHVFTSHLRGDYLEFGVYQGSSLADSYRNYLQFRHWLNSQLSSPEATRVAAARAYMDFTPLFHGLDTFAGMPQNQEGDVNFAPGSFPSSVPLVEGACRRAGLRPPQMVLYPGLFTQTRSLLAQRMKDRRAAIVNIDCDLYESARDALHSVVPYL